MFNFLGSLRVDFARAYKSKWMLLTIIGIVMLSYLASYQELSIYNELGTKPDLIYIFDLFVINGSFGVVFIFFGLVPYGRSFCIDIKNQYLRLNLIRASKSAYTWSKVITVAFSAFSVVLIGFSIVIMLFSMHMEIPDVEYYLKHDNQFGTYSEWLFINPIIYIFAKILILSSACMFWAVLALLISACYSNTFVVFGSPIIIYYITINIVALPPWLSFNTLQYANLNLGDPLSSFLYTLGVFLFGTIILGCFFSSKVKRRISDG